MVMFLLRPYISVKTALLHATINIITTTTTTTTTTMNIIIIIIIIIIITIY